MKALDIRQHSPAVGQQVALLSILGFWLFYALVVTLRATVMDFPAQGEMLVRRGVVTVLGVIITFGMYLVLRLFDSRPLSTRIMTAFAIAIPGAIAVALFNFYVFNIYDPASILNDEQMEEMRKYAAKGNFTLKVVAEDAISRFFFLISWASFYLAISYAGEVRAIERKAARYAQAAQDAELRSLRYQVNPHFLFNTLNSLSALVMRGQPDDAETMILNLSKFYRNSLSGDPLEEVPLSQEVHLQHLYLDIEAVRFPERLRTRIDVPDELLSVLVPGLILQPLVENAIKYGVSRSQNPVTITISARQEDGDLVLNVADDGEAKLGDEVSGSGIGLANVRDRLETRFGSAASVTISRPESGGFQVVLRFPMVHDV